MFNEYNSLFDYTVYIRKEIDKMIERFVNLRK